MCGCEGELCMLHNMLSYLGPYLMHFNMFSHFVCVDHQTPTLLHAQKPKTYLMAVGHRYVSQAARW